MNNTLIILACIAAWLLWRNRNYRRLSYAAYLRSPWWRWLVRPLRLWLDGWRCVTCHERRALQVHHASYKRRGTWLFWREVRDTVTLCNACHDGVHWRRNIKEFAD